jgi:hypothetical protein
MSWSLHHSESENYAGLAEEASKQADIQQALEFYRLAAQAETQALDSLESDKYRTIGITAVSAVSLWFKAQELRQAEQLAYQWLMTDLLPEFAIHQLRELLQRIWVEKELQKQRA